MLQLLDTNPESILKEMLKLLESNYKSKIYEGDQRYIFVSTLAYIIAVERAKANLAFNQNFLSEAYGGALDQKGIDLNTPRLGERNAEVTCKFVLSREQIIDYKIPQGTRVGTASNQVFETIVELVIKKGEIEGIVKCRAIYSGSIYNDIDINLINKFVDVLPYISSVTNINKSSGGTDVEDDDAYRERLKIAEAQYSTAGSILSYKYLTLKADASISDALITSPEPGIVEIKPVLKTGELPTETIINRIKNIFEEENNYPNTTKLNIVIPDIFEYGIDLEYYIKKTDKVYEKEIKNKVEQAVEEFVDYQKTNINIYLNPDDLKKRMLNAGAYLVNITTPVFTQDNIGKVLVVRDKNIRYEGLI